MTSISGTGFGGLPTFGNREIKGTFRLRDGETNMLAGLIRDDERQTLNGIPGLRPASIAWPTDVAATLATSEASANIDFLARIGSSPSYR